jgi:glutathione S-transferase
VGDLSKIGAENFGCNPLHQIPVLEDGGKRIIESDIICEYLLRAYGKPGDGLALFPPGDDIECKVRLSLMNGGMAAGVKLVRGKRSGLNLDCPFFRQEQASISGALEWLDKDLNGQTAYHGTKLTLLDISLMCFAQWAVFREMIPSLAPYKNIERFVNANKDRASFAQTHPGQAAK